MNIRRQIVSNTRSCRKKARLPSPVQTRSCMCHCLLPEWRPERLLLMAVFSARRYASAVPRYMQLPCVCPSVCRCVCLSNISRSSIRTIKPIITQNAVWSPRDSSFLVPRGHITHNGGTKYMWGKKNLRLLTNN